MSESQRMPAPESTSLFQVVRHFLSSEVIRYYLVAGCVALFYLLLVWGGLALHLNYMFAIVIAQIVTILVAFPLYRRLVFRSSGPFRADFFRFLSVWLSGMVAGLIATPLLVELVGVDPFIAQVISIVVVSIGSFVAHKFFSFRSSHNADTESPSDSQDSLGSGH